MSSGHGRADGEPAPIEEEHDSQTAAILIGDDRFSATAPEPFVFGRADATGIVGLDPSDMGISAKAGGVEFAWGVWWLVNHSLKRRLLIEEPAARAPRRLECGNRYAITSSPLVVLVPGAVYTHRIQVLVPDAAVARLHVGGAVASGTLTWSQVHLSDKDRLVLAAVFAGYLRSFPRHDGRPLSYQDAAEVLGPPWTRVTVRKQIERIKERFAREGLFFDGPRANDGLAEHLLDNGLLVPGDLALVDVERRP